MGMMQRGVLTLFFLLLSTLTLSAQVWSSSSQRVSGFGPDPNAPPLPPVPDPSPTPLAWDMTTAAHLMGRAGFSAPPEEIERLVRQGLEATLQELLYFENVDNSALEAGLAEKNYTFTLITNQGREVPNQGNMARWWLYRMIHSRHQLVEKMTYFWHDHFATSVTGVRQVNARHEPLVMVQNELFRRYALGNFKELVHQVARDPAMLFWLDNRLNVKGNPNENWARELLELFTMGIGNYTEKDIQEAARAFTGWTVNRRTLDFQFRSDLHDFGTKTFLGVQGNLDGDDIIEIIFQQQVTAEFIARKLFEFFVYPDPPESVIRELAGTFRQSGYEMRALLEALFRHPEFYSTKALRAHIKSPVELVVATYRELGIGDPQFLPRLMEPMGQQLFVPPDVGGWTTGIGWINTTTLLARYNFFNYVATRRRGADMLDVDRIIQAYGLTDPFSVAYHFVNTLLNGEATPEILYALEEYLQTDDEGRKVPFNIGDPVTVDKKVRGVIYLVLVMPIYQLN